MNKLHKLTIVGLAALMGTVAGEGVSMAVEPIDNTNPATSFAYGPASLYNCTGGGQCWAAGIDTISPAGDVDYQVVVCGAATKISKIHVNLVNSGDLDIQVYRLDGVLLGSSTGTTSDEWVNFATPTYNALLLKVYGFGSATNTYGIDLYCR